MIREKKLDFLLSKGVKIKYHFGIYPTQRRLIIDQVEEFSYNNNAEDQKVAREHVDLLYWEWTRE